MAASVPLRILVTDPALLEAPELKDQIETLAAQGHSVTVEPSLLSYDFICGPNCWFLRPEVAGLFSLALNNARKVANADKTRAKQQTTKAGAPRKPRVSRKPRVGTTPVEAESSATNLEPSALPAIDGE